VSDREVHVELLLGRRVLAANGRSIGRLEEVRADRRGAGGTVTEYVIGPAGLAERLSAWLPFLATRRGFTARWDQIDVSDPHHPRLLCSVEELQPFPGGGRR
jgi:sporulation protein YlmC with PRC-barrel domain